MNPLTRMTKLAAIELVAAAGLLAPALAAPAAASASARTSASARASASTPTPTIVLGGFTDHGYQVAVAIEPDSNTSASIEFDFVRHAGRQYQLYTYDYSDDAAFEMSSDRRTADVKVMFGKTGEIALNLRFATKSKRLSLPDQYALYGPFAATVKAHTGLATGELKFDSHSVFGTIKRSSLRAYLTYTALPQGAANDRKLVMLTTFGSSKRLEDTLVGVHLSKLTMVAAGYSTNPTNAFPFDLDGEIFETSPVSIFTNVGITSSRISVKGPFMSGTTSYHSTLSCGKGVTFGAQTGSVVAHFTLVGRQVFPGKTSPKTDPGMPTGLPNPYGMMMNGSGLASTCPDTADGSATSTAFPITLP